MIQSIVFTVAALLLLGCGPSGSIGGGGDLLGKRGLGPQEKPAPDAALVTGDIAFHEHTGGHIVTPEERRYFLEYADQYFARE